MYYLQIIILNII